MRNARSDIRAQHGARGRFERFARVSSNVAVHQLSQRAKKLRAPAHRTAQ
jgi:hypothetical protein